MTDYKVQLSIDAGNTWSDLTRGRTVDDNGNIVIKTYPRPEAEAIVKQLTNLKKKMNNRTAPIDETTKEPILVVRCIYDFRCVAITVMLKDTKPFKIEVINAGE